MELFRQQIYFFPDTTNRIEGENKTKKPKRQYFLMDKKMKKEEIVVIYLL
jgi:hypothetical protein